MERVIAAIVNDPAELAEVLSTHREMFQIADGLRRGGWGIGYHQHGEILVRKQPLRGPVDVAAALAATGRCHQVAWAGPPLASPFRLEQVQPLRYRNWLFACTGGRGLSEPFVARVTEHVAGFTAHGRRLAGAPEAIMLVFMRALHAAGELDHRGGVSLGIRRGLQAGARALRDLLGDLWERVALAVVLHVRGLTFGLSLGRALHRVELTCGGRGGDGRGPRAGASSPQPRGRGLVITDRDVHQPHTTLPRWSALELRGPDDATSFSLDTL